MIRGSVYRAGLALLLACVPMAEAQADAVPAEAALAGDPTAQTDQATPDGEAPQELTPEEAMARFEAQLDFQEGHVDVGDGLARLELGESLRFLGPEDAGRVLQAWGNPPGELPLGMVFPADVSVFADESWGVVVTYEEDGHVEDDDAADIDYDELLETMQSDAEEVNAERREAGYEEVHLIGWAEPPHYDANSKKLYWAKELDFGAEEHTLNYAVRVLGRKGVLQLNAVASMSQLPMIRTEMGDVIGRVDFNEGNRYADFDPELDEVAAYGIGALIAGKAAAKVGLFKGLLAVLLASKKLLVVGGIAVLAAIKGFVGRLTGRGGDKDSETA